MNIHAKPNRCQRSTGNEHQKGKVGVKKKAGENWCQHGKKKKEVAK